MAVIQRAWNRRAIRWPAAIGCALALGAYLTLGDLQTLDELESPSDTLYLVASAVGIALLIAVFGWHGVWLMIVATIGVTLAMVLFVPYALVIAGARTAIARGGLQADRAG